MNTAYEAEAATDKVLLDKLDEHGPSLGIETRWKSAMEYRNAGQTQELN